MRFASLEEMMAHKESVVGSLRNVLVVSPQEYETLLPQRRWLEKRMRIRIREIWSVDGCPHSERYYFDNEGNYTKYRMVDEHANGKKDELAQDN